MLKPIEILLSDPKTIQALQKRSNFLVYNYTREGKIGWKIESLNCFARLFRTLFGCYANSHSKNVARHLSEVLSTKLQFDNQAPPNIRKMAAVAHYVFQLQFSRLREDTATFVNRNSAIFKELMGISLPFRLKPINEILKLSISQNDIYSTNRKSINEQEDSTKKIKYAESLNHKRPLVCTILSQIPLESDEKYRKRVKNEIEILEKVKDFEGCIAMRFHTSYCGKKGNKTAIFADRGEGNLENRRRDLDNNQKLTIAHQILQIGAAIHERNIWYRDFKPSNFIYMTDSSGDIQIRAIDFSDSIQLDNWREKLYGSLLPSGTEAYAPPELLNRWKLIRLLKSGLKSDIYSLGMTIAALYIDDLTLLDKKSCKLEGAPLYLSSLVRKMVASNPANRPSAQKALQIFEANNIA